MIDDYHLKNRRKFFSFLQETGAFVCTVTSLFVTARVESKYSRVNEADILRTWFFDEEKEVRRRRGKLSNIDDDTNNHRNETPKQWFNAYEKFRKEALFNRRRSERIVEKTKQCMAQEDEVQLRLYAELDLIYGSSDENSDFDGASQDKKRTEEQKKTKEKQSKHKDLVHERVRIGWRTKSDLKLSRQIPIRSI